MSTIFHSPNDFLVESLAGVVLLLLVDHDADDDAGDAGEHAQQEEEEHLHAGHGRRLGVVGVVSGKRK